MNDAEKLREIVEDYRFVLQFNSKLKIIEQARACGKKEKPDELGKCLDNSNYLCASQADFRIYSKEEAKLIDAMSIPFDIRVKNGAFATALEIDQSKKNCSGYTFKGHNRQYYEKLRMNMNEKISQTQDMLEIASLIAKYGAELNEAYEFFELIETVEMLKQGDIWSNEMKSE